MGLVARPNEVLVILTDPRGAGGLQIGLFSTFCIVTCTVISDRPIKLVVLLNDASKLQTF
jgi:hypothetical protein